MHLGEKLKIGPLRKPLLALTVKGCDTGVATYSAAWGLWARTVDVTVKIGVR